MKSSTIQYYFKEGFYSLFRNRLMSIASIGTVASCIFIISLTYCVAVNLDYILEQIESTVGVTVYMERDLPNQQVEKVSKEIQKIPHVENVEYISPEQAIEKMAEYYGEEQFEGLKDDNPLSKSFTVFIDEIVYQEEVVKELQSIENIKNVRHGASEAKILMDASKGLRIASIFIILLLSFMSIIIIINTIKLSVHNRKNEISIMKLVGATDWFIRWPFVIEGMLLGCFGVILPLTATWFGYNALIQFLTDLIGTNTIGSLIILKTGAEIFRVLSPFAMFFGVLLGSLGSILSIRKYLKV